MLRRRRRAPRRQCYMARRDGASARPQSGCGRPESKRRQRAGRWGLPISSISSRSRSSMTSCAPTLLARNLPLRIQRRTVSGWRPARVAASETVTVEPTQLALGSLRSGGAACSSAARAWATPRRPTVRARASSLHAGQRTWRRPVRAPRGDRGLSTSRSCVLTPSSIAGGYDSYSERVHELVRRGWVTSPSSETQAPTNRGRHGGAEAPCTRRPHRAGVAHGGAEVDPIRAAHGDAAAIASRARSDEAPEWTRPTGSYT